MGFSGIVVGCPERTCKGGQLEGWVGTPEALPSPPGGRIWVPNPLLLPQQGGKRKMRNGVLNTPAVMHKGCPSFWAIRASRRSGKSPQSSQRGKVQFQQRVQSPPPPQLRPGPAHDRSWGDVGRRRGLLGVPSRCQPGSCDRAGSEYGPGGTSGMWVAADPDEAMLLGRGHSGPREGAQWWFQGPREPSEEKPAHLLFSGWLFFPSFLLTGAQLTLP